MEYHNLYNKLAAAYIRVSDERQDEYSPDSQLKKIREYAAREGYYIPDEYVFYDDGISGRNTKKRGDFNRMIAMSKEKDHPFETIFVWKFSRFARNQEQSIVYKNLLRKKGVSVVSVSEPIPEGPFGALIERIIEWMDEFYSINLSTEVTRGMTEKASRGEPNTPPPVGYYMKDKKWFPDEEAANIVREVFTRYANGEGQRTIAVDLGNRGIRTKFGGKPENRWIDYMLNNPSYIGMIRWSLDGARAVAKRDYHNENIMIVPGQHEPIISAELWETVQKKLEEQRKKYPKYAKKEQQTEYMLKGLVRCSSCGGTLAASAMGKRDKYRSLQCCNYQRGSCRTSHSITLPKIEAAFIKGLEQAIVTQTFTITPQAPQKNKDADAPDYDKLIALEERRLERAKDAYLNDIDTLEQYNQKKEQKRVCG
ncbi:MAG: recombinase family protein, partial [Eubacteriales bacterium]